MKGDREGYRSGLMGDEVADSQASQVQQPESSNTNSIQDQDGKKKRRRWTENEKWNN